MSEITVITDAVRDEGRKWLRLSDRIAAVKSAAEQLHLAESAFFIGDANTFVHAGAYRDFHSFVVRVLGEAVTEFEQLSTALRRIADAYDDADAMVALDLNKVYQP